LRTAAALPSAYAPGDIRPLEEVERNYILAVLRANAGNKTRTAEQLQIGTATLYRKLKQYEDEGSRAGKVGSTAAQK
jgi:DNA-binding NtrC family response regulator